MTRTVQVDATGQAEALPELASIKVAASETGETTAAAYANAKDQAAAIRSSVTSIDEDQVRTVDFTVEDPADFYECNTDAPFEATERLEIDCTPDAVEEIVVDVTDAGGMVREVNFKPRKSVARQLEEEALTGAMQRAREKAESIASTECLGVGDILDVTEKRDELGMDSLVDEALEMNPGTAIQPSLITVSETVEVTFELTDQ